MKLKHLTRSERPEGVLSLSGFNVRQRYEAIDDWSQFEVHSNEWTRVHSAQSSWRSPIQELTEVDNIFSTDIIFTAIISEFSCARQPSIYNICFPQL